MTNISVKKLFNSIKYMMSGDNYVMYWSYVGDLSQNWGDKLNPYLAEKISGNAPTHRPDIYPITDFPVHYWIGSHLAAACSNPRAEIWGSGFISNDAKISGRPRKIHAVRGHLSREKLVHHGITPPDVVGDAALLLPLFYQRREHSNRTKIGLIPHIHEQQEPFFQKAEYWDDVKVIDITGGVEEVVDQICGCDFIISSSLHGIICADAYGIPSRWIEASDKIKGDRFKFLDYFSSVSRTDSEPLFVGTHTSHKDLLNGFPDYTISFDRERLLSVCPLGAGKMV